MRRIRRGLLDHRRKEERESLFAHGSFLGGGGLSKAEADGGPQTALFTSPYPSMAVCKRLNDGRRCGRKKEGEKEAFIFYGGVMGGRHKGAVSQSFMLAGSLISMTLLL